ncbi:hypothetical protein ACOMHN_027239 [Nucella lapillus]
MSDQHHLTTAAADVVSRPHDSAAPTHPISADPASVTDLRHYPRDGHPLLPPPLPPSLPPHLSHFLSAALPLPPDPLARPPLTFLPAPLCHGGSQLGGRPLDNGGSGAHGGEGPAMKRARVEGGGGGGGEGPVMVHWGQSGSGQDHPGVAPGTSGAEGGRTSRARSADDNSKDGNSSDDVDALLDSTPQRERLSYTPFQLDMLNSIFGVIRYPNGAQKAKIAKRMGITREQVKVWFQNRRRKDVVTNKNSSTSSSSTAAETATSSSSAAAAETVTSSSREAETATSSQLAATTGNASPTIDVTTVSTYSPSSTQKDSNNASTQDGWTSESPNPSRGKVYGPIIKGVIDELLLFTDEKLKELKEKRRARGKRRHRSRSSTAASPSDRPSQAVPYSPSQPMGSLLQTYDIASPPNRVTPTAAYLDTTASRFSHSLSSSAFSSPRDILSGSSMPQLSLGVNHPSGAGLAIPFAPSGGSGGLGPPGLGVTALVPSTHGHSVGMARTPDTLTALSDLISYRQQMHNSGSLRGSHDALLPHCPLSAIRPSRDSSRFLDTLGTHPSVGGPSVLEQNRMFDPCLTGNDAAHLSRLHPGVPLRHGWLLPHSAPSSDYLSQVASLNNLSNFTHAQVVSLGNPFFPTTTPWGPPGVHPPSSKGSQR